MRPSHVSSVGIPIVHLGDGVVGGSPSSNQTTRGLLLGRLTKAANFCVVELTRPGGRHAPTAPEIARSLYASSAAANNTTTPSRAHRFASARNSSVFGVYDGTTIQLTDEVLAA